MFFYFFKRLTGFPRKPFFVGRSKRANPTPLKIKLLFQQMALYFLNIAGIVRIGKPLSARLEIIKKY